MRAGRRALRWNINRPSALGFSIAFLALLLTGTQRAIQRTARLALGLTVLVDMLRTQPKTAGCRQPTLNLLGTPLLTQIGFDTRGTWSTGDTFP